MYLNFSYPLFFLIFILLFSKDIKLLFKRIISVERKNSGMKFVFANADEYFIEADSVKEKIVRKYGDTILNQKGGAGGVANAINSKYRLVYYEEKLKENIADVGIFESIQNLYISYESLKEKSNYDLMSTGSNIDNMLNNDFVIQSDELIKNFYEFSLQMKFEVKVLKPTDVFSYQNLIKDSLVLRQNLVIEENNSD
ncbi:hypothetical protein [Staphylococcus xylosus]